MFKIHSKLDRPSIRKLLAHWHINIYIYIYVFVKTVAGQWLSNPSFVGAAGETAVPVDLLLMVSLLLS